MVVPDQVRAGESFQVIVNISKGNIQSFSRFQQDLPYGLTAERVSSSNADFSFENQRVRFIWLKLPVEENIQIAYNVKVDERLKGNFKLNGEFSFIEGDLRKALGLDANKDIAIIPSKIIPDSLLVDIKDFEATIMSKLQAQNKLTSLMVQRKNPSRLNQREFLVEMKISKGNISRFAKIEEYIPEGYTAFEVDSKNGIFSFQDQTMKILWMDVPEDPDFIVSYKLYKNPGKTFGDLNISGIFYYIEGNQTKSIEIIQKDYDLAILTSGDTVRALDIAGNIPGQESGPEEYAGPVRIEEIQQSDQMTVKDRTDDDDTMLQPENGIYFRIQLLASHEDLDVNTYFAKFRLILNVKKEIHEGLRKYTVGSFTSYKDATDYCSYLWSKTNIKDAFVTAYYNGRRIAVHDAIMMKNK